VSDVTRFRVSLSGFLIAVILLATVQHVAFPGVITPSERSVVEASGDDADIYR